MANGDGTVEVEFSADVTGLNKGMRQAEKAMAGVSKGLVGVAKEGERAKKSTDATALSMNDLRVGLVNVGTAALVAVGAFASITTEVVGLRTELTDLSARSGIATETLAGLRLAAEGSGLTLSELQSSLSQFPKRIADVARGTGEAKVAFEALGIEVTDQSGSLRSADEVMREFLVRLSGVKSPTEQAALATQAFGESGTRLLQALGDPSALEDFIGFSQQFGLDVGPQASQSAQDFTRATAELKTVFQGAKGDLADFIDTTGRLEDFTTGFVFTVEIMREAVARLRMEWDLFNSDDPLETFAISVAIAERGQKSLIESAEEATREFVETRESMRSAAAGAEEYSGAVTGATFATDEAAASAEALRKELEKLAIAQQELALSAPGANEALAQAGAVDEITEANKRLGDVLVESGKDRAAAEANTTTEIERQKIELSAIGEAAMTAGAGFGFVADALSGVKGAFDITKQAAVAFFRAQQAASIGAAIISTAEAVIKAFALFGPPPSPAGILAAATASATGATQVATIAAQKPPSFHIGGVVPESAPRLPGGGPNDRLAVVEPGEEILTERDRRRAPTVVNVIQMDHRFFEASARRSMSGGALAENALPEIMGQRRFRGRRG